MRSLRGVLRGLLIAPLVPLAILSGILVWTQWTGHRDEVYEGLARDAAGTRMAIDQEVEIGKAILDTLAASALIDARDWVAFRRLALEALRDRPDSWIALGEASGLQVMRTFEPVGAPTMNPNVFAQQQAEVDWNGHRLPVSTQGLSERVVRTGSMSSTGVYFGAAIQRPAVAIGTPVVRDGRVTHVLILGFAPDRLSRLVRQSAHDGRRIALFDAEGRLIASSLDGAASSIGRPVDGILRELARANESGWHRARDASGEPVVAAYRRVSLTDWTVVVESTHAAAFGPPWRIVGAWSALALAVLLASAWAARTLWLRLAPSLVAMGRSARAIQRGERPELPDSGIAEIDELGALLRDAASAEARSRDEALRRAVAEESMRAREASERLLRRVLDNLYAFVAVLDIDGALREINRTALERGAMDRDDAVGRAFWDCPWWGDDPRVRAGVREAVARAAAGGTVRQDVRLHGDGQGPVTVDLQLAPLRDASGAVSMLIACGVDVTERERTEASLREADRQKDEFLAVLSHELRNPLAPIRSANHAIRARGLGDPAIARATEVVDRQVGQMVRLVDDLLEVARITQGRIELHPRPERLVDVVATAIEAARPAIESAGQRLEVSCAGESPVVDVDPTRLSQAVLNVLHNATKYTPAGGRIAVAVARDGELARVAVEDDGIGIDPQALPRIFDMFVQGGRDAGRGPGGLGIGLALARRLLEMHGGTIRASSDGPGHGSRFEITLPLASEAPPREVPPQAPVAHAPGRSVLVVDDNADAATTMQIALELDGHSVRTALDGRQALRAAAETLPDAVLLDIGLPDIDGLEVARRLRATYGAACPRLIALSGWGQESDKQRAREAGFERHFTKPVDPAAIAAVLAAAPGPDGDGS